MAELVFIRRGEELMRVLLDRDRTIVGRGAGCDVAVPHPEVSRRHAAIERRGQGFVAVDLTGRDVPERPLDEGAELVFGDFRAIYRASEEPGDGETRAVSRQTRAIEAGLSAGPAVLRIRNRGRDATVPLRNEATIGKDPSCTVVVDDPLASSFHCKVSRQAGRLLLQDLGSTNGTWVGGLRIGQAEIPLGVAIRVGGSEVFVEAPRREDLWAFEGIVSQAPAMREVFELIERVAPSTAPVAILGETGTGKELVARAIHLRSERSEGPLIPVNCAAISRELVESELFGHEKGAFTGALNARKGAFEEASGGTIFLDEIGELSADLQAKLLRTLESGEIKRVGSSRPFRVDTRVVCATHRDLRTMVQKGTFREDLYYRLCVIRVELPPLRRRKGDVAILAEHFARSHAPKSGAKPSLGPDALQRLEAHGWPGNVRELKNVLARALLLRRSPVIGAGDVFFDSGSEAPVAAADFSGDDVLTLSGKTLAQVESEAVLKALRRHGGNRRAAARELGLARSTIQKRAAELGVPPPSGEPDEEAD